MVLCAGMSDSDGDRAIEFAAALSLGVVEGMYATHSGTVTEPVTPGGALLSRRERWLDVGCSCCA